MAWQFSILQLPPLLGAVIAAGVVWLVWDRREDPLVRAFLLFMGGLLVWSASYAIQIGFTTVPEQLVFDKLGYIGALAVPPAWFVLTTRYAGYGDWLSRPVLGVLGLEPIAMLGLVWTNGIHGLVYESVEVARTAGVPVLTYQYGIAYWVNLGYAYVLVLAGLVLILDVLVRGSRLYRRQATLLVLGAVGPLVANWLFSAGASPVPEIDLTTFTFSITGVVFAVGLFRFDLLNRTPIAHRRFREALDDGVIVIDQEGRVVEFNPTAAAIVDATLEVDRFIDAVFPDRTLAELDGTELETRTESGVRYYSLRCVELHGHREEPIGHLIALREVTDRKAYEQRLEVANRLLRHNLRNDVNLILGHADNLERHADEPIADDVRAIRETARRLSDLSEKASRMETPLRYPEGGPQPVDVAATVTDVVDRYAEAHPDASIETDLPDGIWASCEADLLDTAVANVVENAIEHADRTPALRVRIEADERVRIVVADNGPGIPEMEIRALEEGRETALQHGSGVGLWLVHWIVSASGGRVSFETNRPRGSVVTLELPRVAPDSTA